MTPYPLLALVILVIALLVRLVLGVRARRLGHPIPWAPTLIAGGILLVLTLVFDNMMIAVGLMRYTPEAISGLMISLVPIEDLSYPLATALMLPALWHRARRDAHD